MALREDLYFRINTITMGCRRCASARKTSRCCASTSSRSSGSARQKREGIAPAVYHLLIRYRWPGNVRELENAIERAVLVAKGPKSGGRPARSIRERGVVDNFVVPPHQTLAEIEKIAILQTLQRTNWNKQEAAQILGLYRPTLYSKMRKHNIQDMSRAATARRASASTM